MSQLDIARRIAQSAIAALDFGQVAEALTDEEFEEYGDETSLDEIYDLVLSRVAT